MSGELGSAPPPPLTPIPLAAWVIACDGDPPEPLRPNHDKPEIVDPPFHGMPFGGFGAGTFAQTYRGDFARWHLAAGSHTYLSLPACAHLVAVGERGSLLDAFAVGPDPADRALGAWKFRTAGHHYGSLYPRSWLWGRAAEGSVSWQLTQLSPILPHNYRETSLPVATFCMVLRNDTDVERQGCVGLSWENLGLRCPGQPAAFTPRHDLHLGPTPTLRCGRGGQLPREERGAFALAGIGGDPIGVPIFDAAGDGHEVWRSLVEGATIAVGAGRPASFGVKDGAPDAETNAPVTQRPAGFLAWAGVLPPRGTWRVRYALAWHFPTVTFGSGRAWARRYTTFFGRDVAGGPEDPACRMAIEAVERAEDWEATLVRWQEPILSRRPPEIAGALFNGLYILADGGTAWACAEIPSEDPTLRAATEIPGASDIGRFAILECFTYPYYETLDVRYYGAFPLLFFWPELERQVLVAFAHAALESDDDTREMVHVKEHVPRKRRGVLPHDLGAPREDPWVKVNAYDDIDPNRWKDLGPKFVLLIARYLAAVGWEDRGFLRAVWPAVRAAMENLSRQDRDGDGLPENDGIPDQTFDKWPMTGPSAYCTGLAIAALRAATELAAWCGDVGTSRAYDAWRRKAVASYRRILWRGDRVVYDTAEENAHLVMAGQLSGDWGSSLSGFETTLTTEETHRVLGTVRRSCGTYVQGQLWGVQNGASYLGADARRGSEPDNRHAREVWPGIAFGVASHMILSGMVEEGMELTHALARVIYVDRPFAFNVPEAWSPDGRFRGALYLRATSIWAIEEALRRVRPDPALPSFFAASLRGGSGE
jgi:non-lysosomal glucosylceramidase